MGEEGLERGGTEVDKKGKPGRKERVESEEPADVICLSSLGQVKVVTKETGKKEERPRSPPPTPPALCPVCLYPTVK